jgi:hypothetical protein
LLAPEIDVDIELPSGGAVTVECASSGAGAGSSATPRGSVTHLPLVTLRFRFPPDYPSTSPPEFLIVCAALAAPSVAALVNQHLRRLFTECGGSVCLHEWISWLRSDLLSAVMTNGTLAVTDDAFRALVAGDRDLAQADWDSKLHMCDACFDEVPGRDFEAMHGCDHMFCCTCVINYLSQETSCGRVVDIKCLDVGCPGTILPHRVTALLTAGMPLFPVLVTAPLLGHHFCERFLICVLSCVSLCCYRRQTTRLGGAV